MVAGSAGIPQFIGFIRRYPDLIQTMMLVMAVVAVRVIRLLVQNNTAAYE
ncbi:MAG: hypothetical protein MRQ13_03990 [Candidatus Midichloria sp.]|nr:hypothetical protein [Candidatus Midichloria sp.]